MFEDGTAGAAACCVVAVEGPESDILLRHQRWNPRPAPFSGPLGILTTLGGRDSPDAAMSAPRVNGKYNFIFSNQGDEMDFQQD